MKWISCVCATLLAVPSFAAQSADDGSEFLSTPRPAAPFSLARQDEHRAIPTGVIVLTPAEVGRLLETRENLTVNLPSIDAHLGKTGQPLRFHRYQPFAPGAVVRLEGTDGIRIIQPRQRHFFLAGDLDEGVGLAIEPSSGEITGFAIRADSRVSFDGYAGIGIEVAAVSEADDGTNECGTELDAQTPATLAALKSPALLSKSESPQGAALSYQAVVAIETDTEWMAGKSNDTATAMNWITDLFLAMNVFYERDVETRLLIGDVTFRVGSDPYSVPSNRSDQLDEFAEYWRLNRGGIDRDFAAMFSGRDIGSGSFSGIAWIDTFCENGFVWGGRTVGSYSFNAIGTGRTPANTAAFVGHEIAHNMGSPHTHCYSPAVDQCYSGGGTGCYVGPTSCPAGGKGTIMSYCHFGAPNGAGCGTSKSEFHPTVQALMENRLAANSPSCIAPWSPPGPELILIHGFETSP